MLGSFREDKPDFIPCQRQLNHRLLWYRQQSGFLLTDSMPYRAYQTYHDATFVDTSYNGRTSAGRLWKRHALGVEKKVAVVIREIKAGHGDVVSR